MNHQLQFAAAAVAVMAGVVGVVMYIKHGDGSEPPPAPASIRADRGGIAAGNDVRVQGDHVVSQHDFDADTRQEALRYVRVSREACANLKRRVEALEVTSSFSPQAMGDLMPVQMHPQQFVGEHFGDEVVQTIEGKLEAITTGNIELIKPLTANLVSSMMSAQTSERSQKRRAEKQQKLADEFPAVKQRQLTAIGELCSYFDGLAQGG